MSRTSTKRLGILVKREDMTNERFVASPEGKTLLADPPGFTSRTDPIISVETQLLWP